MTAKTDYFMPNERLVKTDKDEIVRVPDAGTLRTTLFNLYNMVYGLQGRLKGGAQIHGALAMSGNVISGAANSANPADSEVVTFGLLKSQSLQGINSALETIGVSPFDPIQQSVLDAVPTVNVGGVVATYYKAGLTGPLSSYSLVTPAAQGLYRVSVYVVCTTAGAGTLTVTIGYTDDAQAQSVNLANTLNLGTLGNYASNQFVFEALPSAPITIATSIAGGSGSPQYSICVTVEQLSPPLSVYES
jgi:hypothetical protein